MTTIDIPAQTNSETINLAPTFIGSALATGAAALAIAAFGVATKTHISPEALILGAGVVGLIGVAIGSTREADRVRQAAYQNRKNM